MIFLTSLLMRNSLAVRNSDNNIFLRLSEKSLVERAFQLRTELERAASDVSNLFSKIGKIFMDQSFQLLLIDVPGFIYAVVMQKERTKSKTETDFSSKSSSHSSHNSLSYCIRLLLLLLLNKRFNLNTWRKTWSPLSRQNLR